MPDDEVEVLANLYVECLEPGDKERFRVLPATSSLGVEVRVLRLLAMRLASKPIDNHAAICRVVGVLCRVLALQAAQHGGDNEIHDELTRIADACLVQARAEQPSLFSLDGKAALAAPGGVADEGVPYKDKDEKGASDAVV